LELKKSEVREAMFRMQVWNCFDNRVIDEVLNRDKNKKTIEQVVKEFMRKGQSPSKRPQTGQSS
jgi:hypothetical protein